ncbi:hypothetical protein Y032_0855g2709 [Ancylostoma ceylanicum]|nr:hypothetical protein Y032_0855g2709 [Ancylostoma ceylanicum]
MANGFAATILFLIFLFLLARHIRKLRTVDDELPTVNPSAGLPPPYAMPPPPTYSNSTRVDIEVRKEMFKWTNSATVDPPPSSSQCSALDKVFKS